MRPRRHLPFRRSLPCRCHLPRRFSPPCRLAAILLATIGLGADNRELAAQASFAIQDSAGVPIVVNSGPAWSAQPAWRLGTRPLLRIEAAHGAGAPAAEQQFSDGTLMVLSAPGAGLAFTLGIIQGNTWRIDRFSRGGRFINEIALVRESDRWGHDIPGIPSFPYLPPSLGIGPYAVSGEHVYTGDPTTGSVERRGGDALSGSHARLFAAAGRRAWESLGRALPSTLGGPTPPSGAPLTRDWITMKTLKIGIASYDQMKARTMGIARGERTPAKGEPRVWFTSIDSYGLVELRPGARRTLVPRVPYDQVRLEVSLTTRSGPVGVGPSPSPPAGQAP